MDSILLVEIESPSSRAKEKTLGDMVDQVRLESIVDLMVYVMDCFNLPIPDKGGLLYMLKVIGPKARK